MALRVVAIDPDSSLFLDQEKAAVAGMGGTLAIRGPGDDPARMAADADIVLAGEEPVDAAMIGTMERCRAIIVFGIGFDHVDVDAATRAGIAVVNHPGVWTDEVADHAMALLLGLARRVPQSHELIREDKGWTAEAVALMGSSSTLKGRTLGIVGFGRIGRAVARRAAPFGMRLLVCDPYIDPEIPVEYGGELVSLQELLQRSDFVSTHTPLTEETYHLFSETQFRLMKPAAIFINTSRGKVQDERALLRALEERWIAGAGLDVLEEEPAAPGHALVGRRDTIVTPHSAYYSERSVAGLHERMIRAIADTMAGRIPYNLVNREVLGTSRIERAGG